MCVIVSIPVPSPCRWIKFVFLQPPVSSWVLYMGIFNCKCQKPNFHWLKAFIGLAIREGWQERGWPQDPVGSEAQMMSSPPWLLSVFSWLCCVPAFISSVDGWRLDYRQLQAYHLSLASFPSLYVDVNKGPRSCNVLNYNIGELWFLTLFLCKPYTHLNKIFHEVIYFF